MRIVLTPLLYIQHLVFIHTLSLRILRRASVLADWAQAKFWKADRRWWSEREYISSHRKWLFGEWKFKMSKILFCVEITSRISSFSKRISNKWEKNSQVERKRMIYLYNPLAGAPIYLTLPFLVRRFISGNTRWLSWFRPLVYTDYHQPMKLRTLEHGSFAYSYVTAEFLVVRLCVNDWGHFFIHLGFRYSETRFGKCEYDHIFTLVSYIRMSR